MLAQSHPSIPNSILFSRRAFQKALKRLPLFSGFLLPTSVFSFIASASHASEKPLPFREIVVTSGRLPSTHTPLSDFPGNVSVIRREEIENSPALTLPELLRLQPGWTSLDTVGLGIGQQAFGLRGYGEKAGTLVLLDGVRINDPGSGFFAGNSIPLSAIERVEVIRGGASTLYGEGAVGGVIQIHTRESGNRPLSGQLETSAGTREYLRNNLTLSGKKDALSYLVSANHQQWEGWRQSSSSRARHFLAKPSLLTDFGRFTLGYQFSNEHSELPDNLTPEEFASNPRQQGNRRFTNRQEIHRGWLDYQQSLSGDAFLNAKFYLTKDTGFSTGYTDVSTNQPSAGTTIQADWKTSLWEKEHNLVLGLEAIRQNFSQSYSGIENVYNATTFSLFSQDKIKLSEDFAITTGVRYDQRNTFIDVPPPFWNPSAGFTGNKHNRAWSPKACFQYAFAPQSSAWVSLSQSYRLISANDAIAVSNESLRFTSNPSLLPVQARTLETGLRSDRFQYCSGSLALYRSWVKDDIFSDINTSNSNANAIRQGMEAMLNSRLNEQVSLDAGASYSDTHFSDGAFAGKRQVLIPRWTLSGGIQIRPATGWLWRLETLRVTGLQRAFDLENALPTASYTVVNTRLSRQWKRLTAYVAVNNVLNRLYEQFPTSVPPAWGGPALKHNPAPGRQIHVGCTLAF